MSRSVVLIHKECGSLIKLSPKGFSLPLLLSLLPLAWQHEYFSLLYLPLLGILESLKEDINAFDFIIDRRRGIKDYARRSCALLNVWLKSAAAYFLFLLLLPL